ncbi:hypothetical protein F899_01032 [Acinetobacter sp. CIP 101934]|jgi:hypothetical protein|uniref:Uncharacterized protein n=1 Tax=Acinetobacter schindleri CIP 107287 TaxID=1217988 RepID=N9AD09_9GAMM|nr:hypothetical protein F955_01864 [Acinetobacter schindleri CIP 107287]ENX02505.1 hypothetical protein F899_01032 [Acinetobacter sp. CIP 101934]
MTAYFHLNQENLSKDCEIMVKFRVYFEIFWI